MSKEQEELEHQEALASLEQLEQDVVQNKPSYNLPKKFEGKTAEEIAESYVQLESAFGKRNNEFGELRRMTDQLLELKKEPAKVEEPLEVDSLLDNPSKAINDAIDKNPRLTAIERKLQTDALAKERQSFESNHPDWQDTVSDPAFQNWVNGSTVRQKMFAAADKNYNYEVGSELFSTYEQLQKVQDKQASENRTSRIKGDLQAASTETGLSGQVKTKRYRRADLINMRVSDPEKYAAIEPDVRKAYEEGRVY